MFALAFMFLGILLGWLLRATRLPGLLSRLVMPCILSLLFFMGVVIGGNPAIMDNLPSLGMQGAVMAVATIAGSVVVVTIITRLFARDYAPAGQSQQGSEKNGSRMGDELS